MLMIMIVTCSASYIQTDSIANFFITMKSFANEFQKFSHPAPLLNSYQSHQKKRLETMNLSFYSDVKVGNLFSIKNCSTHTLCLLTLTHNNS